MARKKAAGAEGAAAPVEPAKPAPETKPAAKAAVSPKPEKKASPKKAAEPEPVKPVAPMPAAEEEAGETEEKKKRRRAGANKKKEEAAAGAPKGETAEQQRYRAQRAAFFAKELKALEKDVATMASLGASAADVVKNADAAKAKISALIGGKDGEGGLISEAIAKHKVQKPRKERAGFDDDSAIFSQAKWEEEINFNAYRKFVTEAEELKDRAAERLRELQAELTKAGDTQKVEASQSLVAQKKRCTVDDLKKKGGVRAMTIEVPADVMAMCFAPTFLARRFEDAHGVVVERAGGKGGGKGKGGTQLKLLGLAEDLQACSAAIKALNLSYNVTVSTEGKRAGAVIGPGGSNLRAIEKNFDVVVNSGKSDLQIFGEKEKVDKAVVEVKKQLEEASAQTTIDVDVDLAKCIVADGGKMKNQYASDTGAIISVNFDGPVNVQLRGTKDAVDKAAALVEKLKKTTQSVLVKCDSDVLTKLSRGGKGGGKGGNLAGEFASLQSKTGVLQVLTKPDGVRILGDKAKVAACKTAVEALVVKAGYSTEAVKVEYREQLRVLTDDAVAQIAAQHGVEAGVRRGDQTVEIHGPAAAKEAAKAAIHTLLDNAGRMSTIQVPEEAVPAFMAKSFQLIRELQDNTQCTLSLSKEPSGPRTMTIMGGKKQLALAEEGVKKAMASYVAQQADMVTEEVDIDEAEGGLVIGKQGTTAKWIMAQSGVMTLKLEGAKVVIRGAPSQVAKAKGLVAEALKGGVDEDGPVVSSAPAPVKKVEEKKPEIAPDLESSNLFPSLGAALGGGSSKRAARGAKHNAKAPVAAPMPEPKEVPKSPAWGGAAPEPAPANGSPKPAAKSPKAAAKSPKPAAAKPAVNGVKKPAVALQHRANEMGSRIEVEHQEYWEEFRKEHEQQVLELAETEA